MEDDERKISRTNSELDALLSAYTAVGAWKLTLMDVVHTLRKDNEQIMWGTNFVVLMTMWIMLNE
jgi:hypothetical protein